MWPAARYRIAMTQPYRLHYAPDNASLIIRLALEEMDQPYTTVLVNRATREHESPAYRALNPNGLIPVLETPDGPMFETGAILLWLADRHSALMPPPDDPGRAGALKWLFFISNTLHPALRMSFYPERYIGSDRAAQARMRVHMQGEIMRHLDTLEQAAGDTPPLFDGAAPTVIAFYLGPVLRWIALYPPRETDWFDLAQWPRLRAMALALEDRASTGAAIQAEGLGPTPFSAPHMPNPPEGSAT